MALEQILAHKRREVAERKAAASLESLLARCRPSERSLSAALRRGRPGFLLEIKFASPSAGTIREGGELDPILQSYGRHADAVSVLTDRSFFGGSLERLAEVRARLDQPLLCKDFILEPYQVAEARLHGADAILLILAAVSDDAWRACHELAERLGMEVLTEVHDEAEARRAVALGARIAGINNRDLGTLRMDMTTAPRLSTLIPSDRLVVAESGYATRDDVQGHRASADAFLVGSALMKEPDIDRAVRGMVYGRTKVCGLTRRAHAEAALLAGATHGGLIFADASPRKVSPELASELRRNLPLEWVGVFVDHSPEVVAERASALGLSAVQLHGNETPSEVERVRRLVPERCEVWKVARVQDRIPACAETGADRVFLDTWDAGRKGGSGRAFDWDLLAAYPERSDVVLSGGLTPDNAERAAALETHALDVNSGVESAPGIKDGERLTAFFQARRRLPGARSTP